VVVDDVSIAMACGVVESVSASPPLAKPFGSAATLRVSPVEDLLPSRALRLVGVGQTLSDNAFKIGVNHRSV
jgi:hypothetical protein